MTRTARPRIRRVQLREAATPFDCMPWELQNFIIDFLRCHGCEVTRRHNQQMIASAIEARVRRRPLCHAYLNAWLEEEILFE